MEGIIVMVLKQFRKILIERIIVNIVIIFKILVYITPFYFKNLPT